MPPRLLTPRLLLRGLEPADAQPIWDLAGDRRIADTTALIPHPYPRHVADEFVASCREPGVDEDLAVWALVRQEDDRLVGLVSLDFKPSFDSAELGYWTGVPFWGQGFMTEAGRAVLEHGFDERGLASVYANHFTRNPASGRVMEKLGMRLEGVRRRAFRKSGVLEDLCFHSILREEWPGTEAS